MDLFSSVISMLCTLIYHSMVKISFVFFERYCHSNGFSGSWQKYVCERECTDPLWQHMRERVKQIQTLEFRFNDFRTEGCACACTQVG